MRMMRGMQNHLQQREQQLKVGEVKREEEAERRRSRGMGRGGGGGAGAGAGGKIARKPKTITQEIVAWRNLTSAGAEKGRIYALGLRCSAPQADQGVIRGGAGARCSSHLMQVFLGFAALHSGCSEG
jgi:hypothetical protein